MFPDLLPVRRRSGVQVGEVAGVCATSLVGMDVLHLVSLPRNGSQSCAAIYAPAGVGAANRRVPGVSSFRLGNAPCGRVAAPEAAGPSANARRVTVGDGSGV